MMGFDNTGACLDAAKREIAEAVTFSKRERQAGDEQRRFISDYITAKIASIGIDIEELIDFIAKKTRK